MRKSPAESIEAYFPHISAAISKEFDTAYKYYSKRKGPALRWFNDTDPYDNDLVFPQEDFGTGKPTLTKCLTDYVEGILIVAGNPNAGKSSLIISMIHGVLRGQEDTIVIDCTLDDGYKYRFLQHICNLSGLIYSEVSNHSLLTGQKKENFEKAYDEFQDRVKNQRLFTISNILDITTPEGDYKLHLSSLSHIIALQEIFRKMFPNKKIVLFIDALNNIKYDGPPANSMEKAEAITDALSKSSEVNEVLTVVTSHLRKNGGDINIEDLKGNNTLEYGAKAVWIVRNFTKEKAKDAPTTTVSGKTVSIFTIQYPKSKVSSWQGNMHYAMDSATCRIYPITLAEYKDTEHWFNNYLLTKERK